LNLVIGLLPLEFSMPSVLQLTKKLLEQPQIVDLPGFQLRHYQGPEDVEFWLELRRRAFARQKLGVGNWDRADFEREFLAKPWWTPESMLFAESVGQSGANAVVGTVTLARRGESPDARTAVHWLAVLPSYRRRGVGRLLLTAVEAAAWQAGSRQVWLETHAQWLEAAALYRALGYVPS
jgi:GNAT superfamily N-acetyltransferase